MTKIDTQVFKGLAILFMIALHLFDPQGQVLCQNLLYIGDIPLTSYLYSISQPVPYFLILGGYGLYKAYEKGDENRWKRLKRLYLYYWVILIIFLVLGHYMLPDKYEITPKRVLYNFSGYWTTFNGHMWFLLPYVILSAVAPVLFEFVKKFRATYVIGVALVVHICICRLTGLYGESFLYENRWAYTPLIVLSLMFNFLLGALSARERFFERVKNVCNSCLKYKILALGGGVLLFLEECFWGYNFFYQFSLITCLIVLPRSRWIEFGLSKLGDHSMNIWMIHGWFCHLLFRDFIYSFRYPLIIYVVTLTISFAISIIVNLIVKYLLSSYSTIKMKVVTI